MTAAVPLHEQGDAEIALQLEALQFSVAQLKQVGATRKHVERSADGQIRALVEEEPKPLRDPLALLEDAAAHVEQLDRSAGRMTVEQTLAFRVAFIGLTEAAERSASDAVRAKLREQGDQVRRALRRDGVTVAPWYQ